jgi:hypothetical protein
VSNALSLNRSVESLNVGIVVGPVQSTVPGLDVCSLHLLLKEVAVLWAIVSLHHGYGKAPLLLGFQHSPGC